MADNFLIFQKSVKGFSNISDSAVLELFELFEQFSVPRKTILTEAGSYEKYLYFILEGTQRVLYEDSKGRESTILFTYPGNFGGVLDAMLSGNTTPYRYEVLSKSTLMRAPIHLVKELSSRNSEIYQLLFDGLLIAFSGLLHRLVEVQCYSAEEKFHELLRRSPHILQLIPHKYLASYIGIDPTNFSKLYNSHKL